MKDERIQEKSDWIILHQFCNSIWHQFYIGLVSPL